MSTSFSSFKPNKEIKPLNSVSKLNSFYTCLLNIKINHRKYIYNILISYGLIKYGLKIT